jgi:cell wall-associated NlpC family hydrolase
VTALDKRLHAYRDDLADERLRGQVDVTRFVAGEAMQVRVPIANVHRQPAASSMLITQALMGETVRVFDVRDGWAWVQLDADHYVGYVKRDVLTEQLTAVTHRVCVAATLIYPTANIKIQPAQYLPLNSGVTEVGAEGEFVALQDGGFVFAKHVWPLGKSHEDFVEIAERFLHVPYLWGGKTAQGLDCSGLVQLALQACGISCPRDSDMQEESIGTTITLEVLQRGDLVFWDGHVGIMCDATNLLHASGRFMMVENEVLTDAIARIGETGKPVTSVRRIEGLFR